MPIWLDDDEQRELLTQTHTAVLTTLRADGRPVALPVWFVLLDDVIYVRTPPKAAKVKRIRRQPHGTFLVERGEAWAELTAAHYDVDISEVSDPDLAARALAALDDKYAAFRPPAAKLPKSAQAAYAEMTVLALDRVGRPLSWSNAKIRRD